MTTHRNTGPPEPPSPGGDRPAEHALKSRAAELGFLACGITTLDPVPHAAALDSWLARGLAGTMGYLHRQASRRKEPKRIAPECCAVVVVLDNYYPGGQADLSRDFLAAAGTGGSLETPLGRGRMGGGGQSKPRIAKYARGRDYHLALTERLEELAEWLRENGARVARCYTDAGPVPERELAQRAGLGWIGKNSMLIRPGEGSFFFIGSIFTDLALRPDLSFETDRCGSCTRCLEACPTEAFVAPRVLDATRCISYLTVEHRGPLTDEQASKLGGWAFGCDICNDVCPWNVSFARETENPAYHPRDDLGQLTDQSFEMMSEEEFERRFGDTPLERPGLAGMRRNWRAALETVESTE